MLDGAEVDLQTVVNGAAVDSGVPGSRVLANLVETALSNHAALPAARQDLIDELGEQALVDAAGVIGNFQRMVRIADSIGIPVDQRVAAMTEDIREELGLNHFVSARLETSTAP